MKSEPKALYVHIPFCKNICSYCDFAKVIYHQAFVDDYFKSLFFELDQLPKQKYHTIYIGGGTPSCLSIDKLSLLLKKLQKKLQKKYEFTIECNVEDISIELLSVFKQYGINRLSIGVQTFNEQLIRACNRKHTKDQAIKNIQLASQYIENLNVDMIYALPAQTLKDLQEDLKLVSTLPIKHISYYSLIIEPNTVFYQKYGSLEENQNLQVKMYHTIYNYLHKSGYNRYEISNFAKKGYKSKHNLVYWHNQHYQAIGLNASGYYKKTRYTNTRNLANYNQQKYNRECVELSKEDQMFEEIMLFLRLDEGLNIQSFNQKYDTSFMDLYKDILDSLCSQKLIKITKRKVKTTFKGSLLLNQILQQFLPS